MIEECDSLCQIALRVYSIIFWGQRSTHHDYFLSDVLLLEKVNHHCFTSRWDNGRQLFVSILQEFGRLVENLTIHLGVREHPY